MAKQRYKRGEIAFTRWPEVICTGKLYIIPPYAIMKYKHADNMYLQVVTTSVCLICQQNITQYGALSVLETVSYWMAAQPMVCVDISRCLAETIGISEHETNFPKQWLKAASRPGCIIHKSWHEL